MTPAGVTSNPSTGSGNARPTTASCVTNTRAGTGDVTGLNRSMH
eukprot:CAMPEP_0196659280 /NCGR_PEP_ID=MMETSP1086-20130531/34104_1 /TAXON_ID=77921 /ORGANISM="Cyanoptyche  gloeocystis , Strain SAG4.97" /LENGTH=43 /DNA_ID= /DNA_START= /DNA_END= /DNA_ORIENTATION=